MKCWGSEYSGRLGNGENTYGRQYYPVDVLVTPGGALFTGVTEMKTFNEGACVIMESEEELQCWGDNNKVNWAMVLWEIPAPHPLGH